MTTRSGDSIDLNNPNVDPVSIDDVAHNLSHICRWGGKPEDYFSVAEHCVMTAERAPKHKRLGVLMHDCEESILGDNIQPLKEVIPELVELGDKIRNLLLIKFEVPYDPELVLVVDKDQLEWERENIIKNQIYVGLPPKRAKALFLKKFAKYREYLK
jgi:hypothetical protein